MRVAALILYSFFGLILLSDESSAKFAPPYKLSAPTEDVAKLLAESYVIYSDYKPVSYDCLSYFVTSEDWIVEVYENHGGVCGGNPETAPLIMKLRVERGTGIVTRKD